MPTIHEDESFSVPVARNTRGDVYYQMGVERRMIEEPQNARVIAQEYYRAISPIEFEPGTPVSSIRAHTVFGTVRLQFVPRTLAEWLVVRDTRGRGVLEDVGSSKSQLVLSGALDQRAWTAYPTNPKAVALYEQPGEEERVVSITDLEGVLDNYRRYASEYRMKLLREIVGAYREEVSAEVKKPVRSGSGDFNEFFRKYHRTLVPEDNAFQYLPILPHGTLSSRRWGIEVEAVDLGGIKTPKYWVLKGDGSLRSEPNRAMPAHLDECATFRDPDCGHPRSDGCTNDCDCGYEQSTTGQTATGEWNSPVLRSFHSRGLEHICDALADRQTNYSAGVHVHVEAGDLTPEQAAQVSLFYTAWEPLFEAEYHRETRAYCASLSSETVIRRIKDLGKHQEAYGRTAIRNVPGGERYSTVNLCALSSHGTIEFRAMGNMYEYDKLVKWASFLRELLNMAKRGVPQKDWAKVRTFKDVVVLMSIYGKETPTPEWAKDRQVLDPIEQLGRENRRNPNRVQHEDGVADVFEDYTAIAPALTDVSR